MRKREILVVTGSRAEYGYLQPILEAMKKSKRLKPRVLVTGMHTLKKHGYTLKEIKRDRMPIAAIVPIKENDSMLQALSKEIRGIETYCLRRRPHCILVIADRDEPFAAAIVAGHLGIPLAHIAGGDSTGYVVDEPIRHSISKFAHIHFTWTPTTAARLRALGEEKWRIHITGSTAFDTLRTSVLPNRAILAKALKLDPAKKWLLIIQHPTPLETVPVQNQFAPTLHAAQLVDAERIVIYPNSDTGNSFFIDGIVKKQAKAHWHAFESLPHQTFLALLKHADVLIGNSSSGVLEAGFFHTPVVNIGNRQKGREHGSNVIHVPYDETKISRAIQHALKSSPAYWAHSKHPYDRGNASRHIVRVLERISLNDRLMYKPLTEKK